MTSYDPLSWVLTSGFRRVVLWAMSGGAPTGDALSTAVALPVGFAADGETAVMDDGTLSERARVQAVAPALARFADVVELRRWQALGYRVRGVLVSAGRGAHVLWDEPAPIILRAFAPERGGLSGTRLVLHTSAFDAAVATSPDLLEQAAPRYGPDGAPLAWPGVATVVLPAPGLGVTAVAPEGEDTTVIARDVSGAMLASAVSPGLTSLRLPEGTFDVRVACAVRAPLVTYAPRQRHTFITDADGALLTDADGALLTY